jgi:DNA-binding FadR family transcriptional regulator
MAGYPGRGLHGDTVRRIGALIVSGTYPPGAPLFAEDLEAEYGVSKTVIREALKVLAAKGLVDSRPKRGTVVRPRTDWDMLDTDVLRWRGESDPEMQFLRDLSEVRRIIEPEAARLAAARRDEEDLAALELALAGMAAATGDPDSIITADLAFHRALLGAAHNELLTRMEPVIEAGLRVRDRLVHGPGQWPDSVAEHQAIFDAVGAADADAAIAATAALLARAERDVAEAVAQAGSAQTGSAQTGSAQTGKAPTGNAQATSTPTGSAQATSTPTGNAQATSTPTGNQPDRGNATPAESPAADRSADRKAGRAQPARRARAGR